MSSNRIKLLYQRHLDGNCLDILRFVAFPFQNINLPQHQCALTSMLPLLLINIQYFSFVFRVLVFLVSPPLQL